MNIRAKLILLVIGMIVLITGASSVYFILQAPLVQIAREREYLDNLVITTQSLQTEVNRLDSSKFVTERPKFYAARVKFGEAFKYIQQITFLRKADKALADALMIVERLQNLNEENLSNVLDVYEELYKHAEELFVFPDNINLQQFYRDDLIINKNSNLVQNARFTLSRFDSYVNILNDSLESSINVISEQGSLIDGQIKNIQRQSITVALFIVGFIIILIALVALVFANTIAKSVIAIAQGVRALAEGDLSVSFTVKSKDEVGKLSKQMNDFITSLDMALLGIKDAADLNNQVKNQLLESSERTHRTLQEMQSAVHNVEEQARLLDQRIADTRKIVTDMTGGVGQLDARLSDQIAMVEESTASITQMLATIGNMARLAERDKELADALVKISDDGKEVFSSAFERVEAITEQVDKIEEMIEIINNIASQTNLLAMNAAIEAAHAGDAGKGFAVVADEIRKLAEASQEGSKEIADSVRDIVNSIESAKAGSGETNKAFAEIEEKIKDVSRSVAEISNSLAETNEGGRQILTAMTSLRELSASINQESRNMAQNTRSIEATMEQLDQVAESLRGAMVSMSQKNGDMAQVTDLTISLAHQLAAIGKDLEARISHFKTTCEQNGGEITTGGTCVDSDQSEQQVQTKLQTDKLVAGNLEASATLLEI
ncbi:methyl-accepting chemotaxis protein [Gracilinema caldarium]|uniref:Methyl-accepting chemotaxis sensory transducer n=1 Tax=Gracilinema caldarium (strain ATCC 51460 / DSM 7334 / H1) TaxID=744872 RepID=F8F0D6_GRAC1|nr:HAMP domain-containing methyl-accepting chemotaxis protein [Gracilinema caldarium]AEJ19000.1 methyl-accepting chemotaxis sensory transducer [Gracilinema caldarium DSM 7334]